MNVSGQYYNVNAEGNRQYHHTFGPATKDYDFWGDNYGEDSSVVMNNGSDDIKPWTQKGKGAQKAVRDWNNMGKMGKHIAADLGQRAYNKDYDNAAKQGKAQYGYKPPINHSY